ncbi:MAG: hypothetical protein ACI4J5_00720 [Oscillospiraceae bacterium]
MTMDYIYDNLYSKISEHVSLSVTVNKYFAVKRVETAQDMLKHSDHSPLVIGNYLSVTPFDE